MPKRNVEVPAEAEPEPAPLVPEPAAAPAEPEPAPEPAPAQPDWKRAFEIAMAQRNHWMQRAHDLEIDLVMAREANKPEET